MPSERLHRVGIGSVINRAINTARVRNAGRLKTQPRQVVQSGVIGRDRFGCACDGANYTRVKLTEGWEHLVANPVPRVAIVEVGRVVAELQTGFLAIALDLFPGE